MILSSKYFKHSYLVFVFLTSSHLCAQEFWNTGFEYEATNRLPRKWSIETYGKKVKVHLTEKVSKQGTKSLKVDMEENEFYILQSIDFPVKHNKLELNSFVKVLGKNSLTFSLLVFDKAAGSMNSSKPQSFKVFQWSSIGLDVNFDNVKKPKNLLIALKVNGTGTFWVDDFNFLIDGKEYGKGSVDFRKPTSKEIQILNKNVHPVSLDAKSDFSALGESLKGVKIVGLGENSHGSSTIFNVKLQLTKYLVEQQGYTMFALESPAVEADYINDYVLYNKGNREGVIENLAYPAWQVQEILDIIEWIKAYNLTTKNKVSFRGFDMQNSVQAFKKLTAFGKEKENKRIQTLLSKTKELYRKKSKIAEDWKAIIDNSLSIGVEVSKYKTEEEDIKHHFYADILYQSFSLMAPKNRKSRDAFMADNIRSLLNKCDCKIIVSGDNDHLRKTEAKAGYYLKEFFGETYSVIGFTFNRGTYSAYGEREFYEVDKSYTGTYEYLFSKAKYENYFLNISKINDIPLLNKKSGFRVIGSRPQENGQFFEMDIKSNFDAIIYLETSKHIIQKK